jgi:hypothetical protein
MPQDAILGYCPSTLYSGVEVDGESTTATNPLSFARVLFDAFSKLRRPGVRLSASRPGLLGPLPLSLLLSQLRVGARIDPL